MKKSNVAIIVLLVLILVAVLGLGGYLIYNLNNKIDEKNSEIENLKSKNSNVSVEKKVSNTQNNTENNVQKSNTQEMSSDEIIKMGEKLYNISIKIAWNGYCKEKIEGLEQYYWVDESVFDYMTEKAASNYGIEKYENGYRMFENAKGSDIYYVSTDLEIKEVKDNKIVFNAISHYAEEPVEEGVQSIIKENRNRDFVLVKEDEKWKVDEFRVPNM